MVCRAFKIHGMCCQDEVLSLKETIGELVGGEHLLRFDLVRSKMVVDARAKKCSDAEIIQAVAKLGLKGEPWDTRAATKVGAGIRDRPYLVIVCLSALLLALGFGIDSLWPDEFDLNPAPFFYGSCVLIGFRRIFPKAFMALRSLRPDMNLLMVTAVTGAFLIGELFEGAMVSFLFSVSLMLETWSMDRARTAVEKLLSSAPSHVMVLDEEGDASSAPPDEVVVGSLFLVKPGEVIPLDGKIVEGISEINQAPVTGESIPVTKSKGDTVFAGTINSDGTLIIKSTKMVGNTTLATVARLVEEAQLRRSPSEKFVERFARIYTPIVILLALTLAIFPPLAFSYPLEEWIYRALVLMVVACPCALVISTPVSIVSGLTSAARKGVLIKGGEHLEAIAHLRAIALDKTGTLTEGKPQVVKLIPLNGHSEEELLERAAALELSSQHPIAVSIVSEARERGITSTRCTDFRNYPGKGSNGLVRNKQFWIGSHRFMEEKGQETPEIHELANSLASQGHTVVAIGNEAHVFGLIAVSDVPRPHARELIRSLKDHEIKVVMLTGDNKPTADAIAKQLGIGETLSELLPEDKIALIQELHKKYRSVAMVGDGINDAPALAQATVGFAMGTAGSDLAIETADVSLMSDDLSKIPWLITHAERTLRIIKQNISISLLTKAVVFVLSISGYASLWMAIAADTGTSLLVIANGLRALNR